MQVPAGAPPIETPGPSGPTERERPVSGRRRSLLLAAVAGSVVALDQLTKAWAVAALDDGPVEVVGSAVRFKLSRNSGGAFSLFSGGATALAVVALVLVVLIVRLARREEDRVVGLGLALVLGGALGNLADRLFRAPGFMEGHVVDFVDVGAWPVFNVADSAIAVGAVVLVLGGFLRRD